MDEFALASSYKPFLRSSTERLVIGTLRTSAICSYEFFYSGERNLFWKILGEVFHHKFVYNAGQKAIWCREEFLEQRKIGIVDMHELCYRKNNSSKDIDLYSVQLTDILEILDKYSEIHTLIFTSRTPAVGALGLFNIHLHNKGMTMINPIRCRNGLLVGKLNYNKKTYVIRVPYSPSLSSKITKDLGVSGLVPMYKECFID